MLKLQVKLVEQAVFLNIILNELYHFSTILQFSLRENTAQIISDLNIFSPIGERMKVFEHL